MAQAVQEYGVSQPTLQSWDFTDLTEFCRAQGCTVDEIKAFWIWSELYGEETLVQLYTLPQQLASVLEQGQRLKQRAAELKEAIAAKDAQIAQLRIENEQSRIKHKQMLASLSSTESQKPAQKRRGAK